MSSRVLAPLRRVAAMDREERQFRARTEARKALDRIRTRVTPAEWRPADLPRILAAPLPSNPRELAAYFAARPSAFPVSPADLPAIAQRVSARFPTAPAEAAASADRILDGRYDLLGYEDLAFGSPPRWHEDPVHGRSAPVVFWADVPYLDPACGDHKIIWEINRHQHWLRLGRAYHLTGDRRYYDEFVRQLTSWLSDNPPLRGANWASMLELGFRALSWLWALHFFAPAAVRHDDNPAWIASLLVALDRQLTHVAQNLSTYFSPNTHLTGEALAMYVAGMALPELAASERRAATGRDILVREADRQIRQDGGHAELSAHYHRYSTDFYLLALLVARRAGDHAAAALERSVRTQARFLRTLADDSGRLPLLGDDDGGQLFPICGREPVDCRDSLAAAAIVLAEPSLAVSDPPEEPFWLCGATFAEETHQAAPWTSRALEASGYYVSRTDGGDHLIFDAGPHGYLNGGHAHSDALSVVVGVQGRPLLVDSGTATYTMDPSMRNLFRSTAMHNTVVVNGRPQSETLGPFHWRTRADARASVCHTVSGVDYFEGVHDGYAPVTHRRGVLAVHGFGWFIVDHLLGPGAATAESFWHLHPDWSVVRFNAAQVLLAHRDGTRQAIASSRPLMPVEPSSPLQSYAPAYGRVETAACLRGHTDGPLPRSVLTFIPAALAAAAPVVEEVEVTTRQADGWHRAAFRVRAEGTVAVFLAAVENGAQDAHPAPNAWGTADVETHARVALTLMTPDGGESIAIDRESLVRNGTRARAFGGLKPASRTA